LTTRACGARHTAHLLSTPLIFLLLVACESGASSTQSRTLTVDKVIDGDSIVVTLDGRRESVRLIGLDAPELSHPRRPVEFWADEATQFVRARIAGKPVRLVADPQTGDRDDYGRLLRYVYLEDGTLLNELLIRSGHAFAFVHHPFEQQQRFLDAQEQAQRSGQGIWGEAGLAELRWILEQGRQSFRIWPTSNRDWAVAYAGRVRLHVRTAELIPLLTRLVQWSRPTDDGRIEESLAAEGFVPLPQRTVAE